MQNIDPIWFLSPISFIIVATVPILYWRLKRKFTGAALSYSFVAYFLAIIVKIAFQLLTINAVKNSSHVVLGLYYGLQTAFLEVGFAYLFARFAVSRSKMGISDDEGYGLGLAFWENGIYIGALTLLDLVSYYLVFSTLSSSSIAKTLYDALSKNDPSLFYSPLQALPLISLGILERVSSLLAHFSWGVLCLLSAIYKKKRLLMVALPMGMIDFLVPFASQLGTSVFEILVFALSLFFLVVALRLRKNLVMQSAR